MRNRGWFADFVATFVVTLVVAVVVTFLWSLIAHGDAVVDWATSFRFAIILGVALPIVGRMGKKEQKP